MLDFLTTTFDWIKRRALIDSKIKPTPNIFRHTVTLAEAGGQIDAERAYDEIAANLGRKLLSSLIVDQANNSVVVVMGLRKILDEATQKPTALSELTIEVQLSPARA